MLKVQKDGKIMEVTQRAYDVLYKQRGFKVIEEEVAKEIEEETEELKDLNYEQLKELAKKEEIEGYYRMNKEELLKELE